MKVKLAHSLIFAPLCLMLAACGGSGGGEESSSIATGSGQNISATNATGDIELPNEESISSNILLAVSVNDPDGIQRVYLTFNQQNSQQVELCSACGNQFTDTVTGINPGLYSAQPGALAINLWVEDIAGNIQNVFISQVNWQPPVIAGIEATRSADGQQIEISWQNNTALLRYNVYLASQSGVNQSNYTALQNGQALLATESSPQVFNGLDPVLDYFVLLVGVDGSGESTNQAEFSLLGVNANNTPPVSSDDVFAMDEDATEVINPLANDTDADNDALSIIAASSPSGTLTFDPTSLTYTPPLDFNGNVQLNYTISDGRGGSDNGVVDVTIDPVNDAPVAADDNFATQVDVDINIDVVANDTDVDGDNLTIINVTNGVGTADVEADNTITYVPDNGFVGVDDFEYTVEDGNGEMATANVTINVFQAANAPMASNDNYETGIDQALTVTIANGLTGNDVSVDGNGLVVNTSPVTAPTSGQVTLSADGSFVYQPNGGFTGSDSFDYQLIDDNGLTAVARANIETRNIPTALTGESSTITGDFLYIGLGETDVGNGIGSGRYRVGDCTQVGNTVCTFTGRYQEAVNSGNSPLSNGTYSFSQRWDGIGLSPTIARSQTPGSTVLTFVDVGTTVYELALFPDSGGAFRSLFPDDPFANSMGFGAFIQAMEVCQGLPPMTNCDIGQVGLVVDAQITAPLDRLTFNVPGTRYGLNRFNKPVAVDDQYQTSVDTTLNVDGSNGLLINDSDTDSGTIGDNLIQTAVTSPAAITNFVGVGFDQYRQLLITYSGFENELNIYDVEGTFIQTFNVTGNIANSFDIDVAPEAFTLGATLIPQGSALLFNGETGQVSVFAVNIQGGNIIASQALDFGDSEVVGGVYNEVTDTIFVLQNSIAANQPNTVAQINPVTGSVTSTFAVDIDGIFNVSFGDIDANSQTGNLYLVSSAESRIAEFTPTGSFVRYVDLPNIAGLIPSGMGLNHEGNQIWLSTTGGDLSRLEFSNGGRLPQWQVDIFVQPDNGTLELNLDGSFSYEPKTGFQGNDRFVYRVTNASGQTSVATATINVIP